MKIHFTKKEYRHLLDLVFLGDWMVSEGHGLIEGVDVSPYDALREKIYSYAKDFGFDDVIEYSQAENRHVETAVFEAEGVMEYLEAYHAFIRAEEDDENAGNGDYNTP